MKVRKYVEKQEVIKFIDNLLLYEDKLQGVERETLLAVKKKIENTPTADVCPIMRGNWIYCDEPELMEEACVCIERGLEKGDTLYISSDWDGGIGFDYIHNIKFCPVCGRKLPEWRK